ncbi:hypothetical protein PGTUg99_009079 [Puccinia graminis f. sp. tritici]|uniref:Uncharacterized protein n=1 Tax=Puccinia graminis f. sp. tritici TaxID=56615 RepID=A0A5B0SCC9_PUCGR|nr:hypothetical protein PGTUg99_009079 [Puccinia graminis f. sp. tritici]
MRLPRVGQQTRTSNPGFLTYTLTRPMQMLLSSKSTKIGTPKKVIHPSSPKGMPRTMADMPQFTASLTTHDVIYDICELSPTSVAISWLKKV